MISETLADPVLTVTNLRDRSDTRLASRRRFRQVTYMLGALLGVLLFAAQVAKPVPPVVTPALEIVANKMKDLQSLQVEVRQDKVLQMLAETVTTRGTLVFSRPRRLVIDLKGDGGTTLIIDGDTMTTIYKALKRTERTSLSKDPRGRAVAEHLFLLLEADPQALAKVYEVTLLGEKPLRIQLIPRSEALAKILARIEARFDERGFVNELTLFEKNGDLTRWEFTSPRMNETIADRVFASPP